MSINSEPETDHNTNKNAQTDCSFQSNGNQLQGINSLVIDAVVEVTNIVESVHHRVNPISGSPAFEGKYISQSTSSNNKAHAAPERTSGITGAVYKAVRGITELVGKGLNIPLKVIGDALQERPDEPRLMAIRSALNGILGDYLESQNNPLAIDMHFTVDNQQKSWLKLSQQALTETLQSAIQNNDGKVLIMLHGLCMNDRQWCHHDHDHGAELAKELDAQLLYLNYNSGLHISQNGQQFAESLQAAVKAVSSDGTFNKENFNKESVPLNITLVTHSMGGLLSRSALQFAKEAQHQWPTLINKLVFLGTPHHGAPLEKTGNWLDLILASHPYTAPFAKLIQVRSSGITDLRFGNLCHQDWQQRNRFDFRADSRQIIALPQGVECFAVAGSIGNLIGDGLVEVDSAQGRHNEKARTLQFKSSNQLLVKGCDHMQLLSDPRAYEQLVLWLSSPNGNAD